MRDQLFSVVTRLPKKTPNPFSCVYRTQHLLFCDVNIRVFQSYMQDMQRKMSPVPGTRALNQTQTHSPELDSTTTTLTQVPS